MNEREKKIFEQRELDRRSKEILEQRAREQEAKQKKSKCFITTAVCQSFDKGDDCYELTQFRRFRDGYLEEQVDGRLLIEEYYRIAPRIVSAIDRLAEAKAVYTSIWDRYLRECLSLIETGDFSKCKTLYVRMVRELQDKYIDSELKNN